MEPALLAQAITSIKPDLKLDKGATPLAVGALAKLIADDDEILDALPYKQFPMRLRGTGLVAISRRGIAGVDTHPSDDNRWFSIGWDDLKSASLVQNKMSKPHFGVALITNEGSWKVDAGQRPAAQALLSAIGEHAPSALTRGPATFSELVGGPDVCVADSVAIARGLSTWAGSQTARRRLTAWPPTCLATDLQRRAAGAS